MLADLTAGAALRWARAAVLSCAVLTFASVAHAGAGGRMPGPFGMTVLTFLTTALIASQLGRPASTARVVTLLAGGQAALHAVFTAAGGHPGGAGAMAHHQATGPTRVAVPRGGIADALGSGQLASNMTSGPSPVDAWVHHLVDDLSTPSNLWMAVAHFAAAVLLGVWLASGERLVWRLVVLLAGPAATALGHVRVVLLGGLAAGCRRVTTRTPSSVVPCWDDPPPPRSLLLTHIVVRRGPPAVSS